MALETFVDVIVEYFKQSSLSPEDRLVLASLPLLTIPLLVGAIRAGEYSKWAESLFFAASSVVALMPVFYMKLNNVYDPLAAFLSYLIAALLLLIAFFDVIFYLIFFVLLKLVDLIFFVLGKLLRDKTNK